MVTGSSIPPPSASSMQAMTNFGNANAGAINAAFGRGSLLQTGAKSVSNVELGAAEYLNQAEGAEHTELAAADPETKGRTDAEMAAPTPATRCKRVRRRKDGR